MLKKIHACRLCKAFELSDKNWSTVQNNIQNHFQRNKSPTCFRFLIDAFKMIRCTLTRVSRERPEGSVECIPLRTTAFQLQISLLINKSEIENVN